MKLLRFLPLLLAAGGTAAATKPPLLGPLKNVNSFQGCGCTLSRSATSNELYYWNGYEVQKDHWLNVAGKDVALTCKGPNGMDADKKGMRYRLSCRGKGVSATIDFEVTSECPPKDDDCEATERSATLKVRHGLHAETLQLVGDCGC
jgi:hypothetical protein